MDKLVKKVTEIVEIEDPTRKKIYRVFMFLLGASIIVSTGIMFLTFFEKPAITFINIPFPLTEQRVYRPGDFIAFVINRCAKRPTQYTLTQTFVTNNPSSVEKYHIESNEVIVDKAGCEIISPVGRKIPETLPTGSYHVEFGIALQGKFRDYVFGAHSTDFDVESDAPNY